MSSTINLFRKKQRRWKLQLIFKIVYFSSITLTWIILYAAQFAKSDQNGGILVTKLLIIFIGKIRE
jgi:hypothetical protein